MRVLIKNSNRGMYIYRVVFHLSLYLKPNNFSAWFCILLKSRKEEGKKGQLGKRLNVNQYKCASAKFF